MDYFPIFLDAKKLNVVVVGGGNVAARKIELLLKTPASITVVSPMLKEPVKQLIAAHNLPWVTATYCEEYLSGMQLVIAATNIKSINQQIANDANAKGLLLNVVDDPQLCNYITPAIIDRSPMIVALSSSGSAPILLQLLKSKIDNLLPASYGKLAEFCSKYRKQIQHQISSFSERRIFWKKILEGDVARLILTNEMANAEELFNESLKQQHIVEHGRLVQIEIYNQDPNNLSLAAYQALQQADTIILDTDIDAIFFDYGRRDANKQHIINPDYIQRQLSNKQQVAVICQADTEIKPRTTIDIAIDLIRCGNSKKLD